MNKQTLVTSLALRTGKHVDVLNRYKVEVLQEMYDDVQPLVLNYQQVSQICRSLITTGGASYRPFTGELNPTVGYMVSIPGFEKIVPRVWNTYDLMTILNDYFKETKYTDESRAFIGLWEHDGKLYIDLSQRFLDLEKAIVLGQQRNQICIWDCANKCEIKTR